MLQTWLSTHPKHIRSQLDSAKDMRDMDALFDKAEAFIVDRISSSSINKVSNVTERKSDTVL